jgi:hypothetical protein
MKTPNPGSNEAIKQGCTCPVMDNCHGAGAYGNGEKYGFWYNMACLIHSPMKVKDGTNSPTMPI